MCVYMGEGAGGYVRLYILLHFKKYIVNNIDVTKYRHAFVLGIRKSNMKLTS
jgi:hypothetical protein